MNAPRNNWTLADIQREYDAPLLQLVSKANHTHRLSFPDFYIQKSKCISVKTGACPEDCGYCPQSGHYKVNITKEKLLKRDEIEKAIHYAKELGADRFCMGAAWRSPPKEGLAQIIDYVKLVKKAGLESCVTLGMLNEEQAQQLANAGVDFYNHNLDTSPNYYSKIISTRTYQDRLETLQHVRKAGLKVCCGGIIGMDESLEDRLELLRQLSLLEPHPESVPINLLVPFDGTPLQHAKTISNFEYLRFVATARIVLPQSVIRLSAGRKRLNEAWQLLCFFAGANSIFIGDKYLVSGIEAEEIDELLFNELAALESE